MAREKKHTPEQIVSLLRQVDFAAHADIDLVYLQQLRVIVPCVCARICRGTPEIERKMLQSGIYDLFHSLDYQNRSFPYCAVN